MKRDGARLAVKAECRFQPVGENQPVLVGKLSGIAGGQAHIGMKKRLRRLRRGGLYLHVDKGVAEIRRGGASAKLEQLGGLAVVAGYEILRQIHAVRVQITLGYHSQPPAGSPPASPAIPASPARADAVRRAR